MILAAMTTGFFEKNITNYIQGDTRWVEINESYSCCSEATLTGVRYTQLCLQLQLQVQVPGTCSSNLAKPNYTIGYPVLDE